MTSSAKLRALADRIAALPGDRAWTGAMHELNEELYALFAGWSTPLVGSAVTDFEQYGREYGNNFLGDLSHAMTHAQRIFEDLATWEMSKDERASLVADLCWKAMRQAEPPAAAAGKLTPREWMPRSFLHAVLDIAALEYERRAQPEMAPLVAEVTGSTYSVELTTEQFLAVERHDDKVLLQPGAALSEKLDKLPGVRNVEYNGHFGAAIYFWLDEDHKHELPKVLKVIENYVEGALSRRAGAEIQDSPEP